MEWHDSWEDPVSWWSGAKRPADEAPGPTSGDPLQEPGEFSKRLCTWAAEAFSPELSTAQQSSHTFFQPDDFTAPLNGWSDLSTGSVGFEASSIITPAAWLYTPSGGNLDPAPDVPNIAVLEYQQASLASTQWILDADIESYPDSDRPVTVDPGQQLTSYQDHTLMDGFMPAADQGWLLDGLSPTEVQLATLLSVNNPGTWQTEGQAISGDGLALSEHAGTETGPYFPDVEQDALSVDSAAASEFEARSRTEDAGSAEESTAGTTPMSSLLKDSGRSGDDEDNAPDPVIDTCFGLVSTEYCPWKGRAELATFLPAHVLTDHF